MEEKRKYTKPYFETIVVKLDDIVTASTDPGGETDPTENKTKSNSFWYNGE